ncbi:MAG: cation transporter [Halomonadaceae bacterium]|nr:MAG: cation transporter [Halomonadaceae bacterium]
MKLSELAHWRSLCLRLVAMLALWLVLTEGSAQNLWFGLITAVIATWVSLIVVRPSTIRWRPVPALVFIPYFLRRSLLGGIDVAMRAFSPHMHLEPTLRSYQLRLQRPPQQAFLAWIITLSPGTSSVELSDGQLTVHLLDQELLSEPALRALEAKVTKLFHDP